MPCYYSLGAFVRKPNVVIYTNIEKIKLANQMRVNYVCKNWRRVVSTGGELSKTGGEFAWGRNVSWGRVFQYSLSQINVFIKKCFLYLSKSGI